MFSYASTWKEKSLAIGLGQSLSICNALTQIFNEYLGGKNAVLPTFQLLMVYFCLGLLFLVKIVMHGKPQKELWVYGVIILLGLLDLEANYLVVYAFKHTNFVVIGLMLNLTIPFSTVLAFVFLKRRYRWNHALGSLVAVSAIFVLFGANYQDGPNEWKGYLSVTGGCVLYAISNITFEYFLKKVKFEGNLEFLGILGCSGAVFSAFQTWALEGSDIKNVDFTPAVIWYLVGFVVALFSFYVIASYVLTISESLLMNISLLTADVINAFVSYFLFDRSLAWQYYIAIVLNITGVLIYSLHSVDDLFVKEDSISFLEVEDLAISPEKKVSTYV